MGKKNAKFLFLKLGAEHTGLLCIILLQVKCVSYILFICKIFHKEEEKKKKPNRKTEHSSRD